MVEQCFPILTNSVDNVTKCLNCNHSVLIALRGVSGSGKSHLARLLAEKRNSVIYPSDGDLKNVTELTDEVANNLYIKTIKSIKKTNGAMKRVIIIDLENVDTHQCERLYKLSVFLSYEFYIVEPETSWKYNASECYRRSKHKSSLDRITEMVEYMQKKQLQPIFESKSILSSPSTSNTSSNEVEIKTPREENNDVISLAPVDNVVYVRDSSTSASFYGVAFEAIVNIEFDVSTIGDVSVKKRQQKRGKMVDRSTSDSVNVEWSMSATGDHFLKQMCYSVFSSLDLSDIDHIIEMEGYEKAIGMFFELQPIVDDHSIFVPSPFFNEMEDMAVSSISGTLRNDDGVRVKRSDSIELSEDEGQVELSDISHYPYLMKGEDTSMDEYIALRLQYGYDISDESDEAVEKSQIEQLAKRFDGLFDKETITRIYYDENRDYNRSLKTLNIFEASYTGTTQSTSLASQLINFNHNNGQNSSNTNRNNSAKKKSKVRISLEEAKKEAIKLHDQKQELCTKYRNVRSNMNQLKHASYNHPDGNIPKQIKQLGREIDRILEEAQENSRTIDLHLMSEPGALAFVKKRMGRMKKGQKLVIICGIGNNSSGAIRKSLQSYLNNNNISHHFENPGCVTVRC